MEEPENRKEHVRHVVVVVKTATERNLPRYEIVTDSIASDQSNRWPLRLRDYNKRLIKDFPLVSLFWIWQDGHLDE